MELMRPDQAAEFLGISRDTLTALMHEKKISYYRLSAHIFRFSKDDLIAYIHNSRVEASSPAAGRQRRIKTASEYRSGESVYYPGMKVV